MRQMKTLYELKPGQRGVIRSVGAEGALRLRLLDMGLIPKTEVTLIRLSPRWATRLRLLCAGMSSLCGPATPKIL